MLLCRRVGFLILLGLLSGASTAHARSLRQADGEVVIVRGGPGMMMVSAPPPPACTATAASLVASSPRLSILSAAIQADAPLSALLGDPSTPLTVFCPTDAAWMTFFDTLGVSRKDGLTHPTTAAALRFLVLPNAARRLESFAPQAKAMTAVGANLTVLSPEAVANLARAQAMRASAANDSAPADTGSDATASFFSAIAPLLAPIVSSITRNGTDPEGKAFVAAMAGLAGSMVSAVSPGAARRRIPRMCEDGCHWTVAGPASGGTGLSVDGRDAHTNNATVLLGDGFACGSRVHVIDEVLLPELLGTTGKEGEARVVSVGDGSGRLVSRLTVPAAGNVSVEFVGGGGAAAVAAPAPAPAVAAAPALSRRVNPEPVDIINPVVAGVVGKQPEPKAAKAAAPAPAPKAKAATPAPAPAPAPKAASPPKKAVAAAPAPSPTLPAVPEDTLIEAGPAIPPAGA